MKVYQAWNNGKAMLVFGMGAGHASHIVCNMYNWQYCYIGNTRYNRWGGQEGWK